jgi:histidinol-phosphate aminotransferase
MIFFCSPNNPTGNEVPLQKLLAFAQSVREQSIVIVDEAYVEFSGRSSIAAHIAEHDNLVILRTLSKAYAMAGARCGAIIATAEIVHMVSAMMSPYAFSQPVTALVLNALEPANRQLAQRQIAATVERRDSLVEMLADSAATRQIWPSAGNFVLAGFSEPESWYAALRSRGILIREYGSDPFIPDCVRISVGSAVEIDRLRLALADAQAELS